MKRFLFLLLALWSIQAPAQLAAHPPMVAAKAYVVTDYGSGQTLLESRAGDRIEPASLTKLMTCYLAFEALRDGKLAPNQMLTVSEHAQRAVGSRMFIQQGKPVSVDELVHGLVIQSGNDAAIALSEGISGSEEKFVEKMNQTAQRLGMKNTHFVNATGLPDPRHYTTAYDLSLLAAAIIREFPANYALFAIKEYKYNNINQQNRNRLLWLDPNVDGMKTGHTESAGFCLVASEKRGARRLISVLIGADSDGLRATESLKILNFAIEAYDSVKLYSKGQSVTALRVFKGTRDTLSVGFNQDLYLSVPKGRAKELKASVAAAQPLVVPIAIGQRVGVVRFSLDGKQIAEYPLSALEAVEKANIFKRTWDSLKLLFN